MDTIGPDQFRNLIHLEFFGVVLRPSVIPFLETIGKLHYDGQSITTNCSSLPISMGQPQPGDFSVSILQVLISDIVFGNLPYLQGKVTL